MSPRKMSHNNDGSYGNSNIEIGVAADEMVALRVVSQDRQQRRIRREDAREAAKQAAARDKITLPKFSWDRRG